MDKNRNSLIRMVIFIAAFTYLFLVLILKKNISDSTCVFISFTLFSFFVLFLQTFYQDRTGILWNTLISGIISIYFILQLIIGGIIGVVFFSISFRASFILELIFNVIFFIFYLILKNIQESALQTNNVDYQSVQNDRILLAKLGSIYKKLEEDNKEKMRKVISSLESSYPSYPAEVHDYSLRIADLVSELELTYAENDSEKISKLIDNIGDLIEERTKRAVIYRR